MQILDGKTLSVTLQREMADQVEKWTSDGKRAPHLAAIIVGDNPASKVYVGHKIKACERVGISSSLIQESEEISEDQLVNRIEALNDDPTIDGFIIQLPLPRHIDPQRVILAVHPEKDVDGFHPSNMGKMALGLDTFIPATPYGIMLMLERYRITTSGKTVVVVGRSNIVGTPMSILLSRNSAFGNATVTLTHSRTQDLKKHLLSADIIVAAIGRAKFITEDMVKPSAIIIDVGINRIVDETRKSGFRLVGDVDFDGVAEKCSFITPVPGGVGPLTVAALLKNTIKAYEKKLD